jgi:hypothetical protein
MTPSKQAKFYGARSLEAVASFSGYTAETLRRYAAEKPDRFRGLCLACVCDELKITGPQLRALHAMHMSVSHAEIKR